VPVGGSAAPALWAESDCATTQVINPTQQTQPSSRLMPTNPDFDRRSKTSSIPRCIHFEG